MFPRPYFETHLAEPGHHLCILSEVQLPPAGAVRGNMNSASGIAQYGNPD